MEVKIFLQFFLLISIGSKFNANADIIQCDFEKHDASKSGLNPHPIFADAYMCNIIDIASNEASNVISGSHSFFKSDAKVKFVLYRSKPRVLTHLDASFCQKFKNLETVILSNMTYQSIDETSFAECNKVKIMGFDNNKLRELPENFLPEPSKLAILELEGNLLSTFPENFFSNQKELVLLNLQKNQINFLPANIFKSPVELRVLVLSDNKLTALNPAWFENLQNLEELDLGQNKIAELPKNVFATLANLQKLILNNNQLTDIHSDSFGILGKLNEITLRFNKINTIDGNFIDNLPISNLNLWDNECCEEWIEYTSDKSEIKKRLQNCINNYQPR